MAPKATSTNSKRKAKSSPSKKQANSSASRSNLVDSKSSKKSWTSESDQQRLLDVFANALPDQFTDNLPSLIQTVKGHLFNRDFAEAFGQQDFLEAYALRWSPPRALAYQELLCDLLGNFFEGDIPSKNSDESILEKSLNEVSFDTYGSSSPVGKSRGRPLKVVCIGGGAGAELVAFAGVMSNFLSKRSASRRETDSALEGDIRLSSSKTLSLRLVDIADWTTVTQKLLSGITSVPPVSKYASEAVRAAAVPTLGSEVLDVDFTQQDVLNASEEQSQRMLEGCALVTILFTLNELYSTSMSKTTSMLLKFTKTLSRGTLLLVVDSPGSYSTVKVGKGQEAQERQYPMQWLLNHTLLEAARGENDEISWETLHENESRWFRLPQGLNYPLNLEDMRCQVHLYRRR